MLLANCEVKGVNETRAGNLKGAYDVDDLGLRWIGASRMTT